MNWSVIITGTISFFLAGSLSVQAQTENAVSPSINHRINSRFQNTISITSGDFYIRKTYHPHEPYRQMGVIYSRRLTRSLTVSAGYSQWMKQLLLFSSFNPAGTAFELNEENSGLIAGRSYRPIIGGLEYRSGYKMIDVVVSNRLGLLPLPHNVTYGLGPSICWGVNRHLEFYTMGTPTDAIAIYYLEKATYWGGVGRLTYSYDFFVVAFRSEEIIQLDTIQSVPSSNMI